MAQVEALPSAERDAFYAKLQMQMEKQSKVWKEGVEPMTFEEFCVELDGNAPFPRQLAVYSGPGVHTAGGLFNTSRTITETIAVHGKRSGKDYNLGKWFTYGVYCLHQMAISPCAYMKQLKPALALAHDTRMDVVNVATNEDVAAQVLFEYVMKFLNSPIMKGIEVYPKTRDWKPGTRQIIFPDTNLHFYCKSCEISTLEGYNLLWYALDEFDEVPIEKANRVHTVFRTSSHATYQGFQMGFLISYPRTEDGFMLKLAERAKRSPKLFYVDIAGTAEVRPDFDRNDPQVQEEFKENPALASAMYDCKPMKTEDAFIEFHERIGEAVNPSLLPAVTYSTSITEQEGRKYVTLSIDSLADYDPNRQYFLGLDAGVTGDSYGLSLYSTPSDGEAGAWFCPGCGREPSLMEGLPYRQMTRDDAGVVQDIGEVICAFCLTTPLDFDPTRGLLGWWGLRCSAKKEEATIDGVSYTLRAVREEAIIEVQPRRKDHNASSFNATVDFTAIENACETLINHFHIAYVGLDPYNSVQMLQSLRNKTGCDVQEVSQSNPEQMKRAKMIKTMLYRGLIEHGPNTARDTQWSQIKRVNNRIDHPKGGKKDLWDAASNCIWLAITTAGNEMTVHRGGDYEPIENQDY